MTIAFARTYGLVPRGGAGLDCDKEGVALLGPVVLVEAVTDPSGQQCYRLRPEPEIAQAVRLAYDFSIEEIARGCRGLARVANS